jgi:hypothetical protein
MLSEVQIMSNEERFEVIHQESKGVLQKVSILRDKQTGVQYIFVRSGNSGGLSPLLDKNGNPLIEENT